MGLPNLSDNDYVKVREANDMVNRSYKIAINCILNRVPFAIENPFHSMIWDEGNLKSLIKLPGVKASRYDFCQFGEIYHKKTKLIYYGWDLDAKARVCRGHHGTCSRTGEKHVLLTGAVECPGDQLHLLPQQRRQSTSSSYLECQGLRE